MYKVIEDFADLQDHEHVYHAGDEFPRFGVFVKDGRIAELAGWSNARKHPLIEKVDDVKAPDLKVKIEKTEEPAKEPEPKRRGRKKTND